MAVDSVASKLQPQFDGTKASNTAADENAISNYAALVGNHMADTSANRTAFASVFGGQPWAGLHYTETDTSNEFIYTGSAWLGVKTQSGLVAFATADLTADGGGYSGSKTIVLASGRFTAAPTIGTGIFTSASTSQHVGVANVTASGFTLYYWRASQVATTVGWTAIPSDS